MPHVTLAGDRDGECVILEERPDGTLVLTPEAVADASLRRLGGPPATKDEFDAFLAEHGDVMLPPDDEGDDPGLVRDVGISKGPMNAGVSGVASGRPGIRGDFGVDLPGRRAQRSGNAGLQAGTKTLGRLEIEAA